MIELPTHRQTLRAAHAAGDQRRLRDCVHKLLGAAVYCDNPELETGLRELQRALAAAQASTVDQQILRVTRIIDSLLEDCGYHAV